MNKNYDASVPFPSEIHRTDMQVMQTDVPGGRNVAYKNGYLYQICMQNGGSLKIFRCEPKLTLVSEVHGLGNTRQIAISADAVCGRLLAAVTARECGVYILDVTRAEKPFVCCRYNSVEFATGIAFGGKYMAIGCRSFGVELVDVSIPEKPKHIFSYRAGEVQSVCFDGCYLYTGSWCEQQVTVIDISNVRRPKTVAVLPLEGRGDGLCVKEGILYAAFGQHRRPATGNSPDEKGYAEGNGFEIWDVKNPESPKRLSCTVFPHRYYTCFFDMWDVVVSGNYAIVSHTFNGVWIYDVTHLETPVLVECVAFETDTPMEEIIAINERTLNVRPFVLPFDYTKKAYAPVTGVALSKGKLYISLEYQNLHIAEADFFEEDMASEVTVNEIGEAYYVHTPGVTSDCVTIARAEGQTHAAVTYQGLLYVACGNAGIGVYDADLKHLRQIAMPGIAMDIRENNGRLFVAAGMEGIAIFRADGEKIGGFSVKGKACAQVVPSANGKFLMVHTDDRTLTIVDVSDIHNPKIVVEDSFAVGLMYHRQLSYRGICDRFYGAYWNSNTSKWYDLSGDVVVTTDHQKGDLSFMEGMTGLDEPYKVLAITQGGYVIADIREDRAFSLYEVHKIGERWLRGKPIVQENILYVSDCLNGDVVICDIADVTSPKLIFCGQFSGNPDLLCPVEGGAVVPLGHQGIAKIRF